MTFISTDILQPYSREIITTDPYPTLIKFLLKYFPSGFERPTDISVNGIPIHIDHYDMQLNEHDIIVLLDRAALPVGVLGMGLFATALANLAISVALSYVVNKLFEPDSPQERAEPSSVYSIGSGQNMARYGSPIPIIYGRVRMYPSMIVQPYYAFENNIEYLYHVLCVGQGTNTTDTMFIGDDESTRTGDMQWKLLYQSDFYNIPLKAYGIHITKTLTSPSNMELEKGIVSENYKIDIGSQFLEFDYTLPSGLYSMNDEGGYEIALVEILYSVYTEVGGVYTKVLGGSEVVVGASDEPIQKTIRLGISTWTATQPVYISFIKAVTISSPRYTEKTYIKRVKSILPNKDFTQAYGDITLVACKIKATNAVSAAGQVKVNGYFERVDVGNSMEAVLTDIYTNTTYGAGLNAANLDFPTTGAVVDCAYDSNQTIFDAMRKPAIAQKFSVFLAGMDVILKKDGENTITSGMYNEMNILSNSLKVQYLFKEEYPSYDGYEATYIDGDGWIPKTVTYPEWAIRPKKIDLFGVVNW